MQGLERETELQLEDLYSRRERVKTKLHNQKETCEGKIGDLQTELKHIDEQILQVEQRQMRFKALE